MKGRESRRRRLIAGRFSRAERVRQRVRISLEDAALTERHCPDITVRSERYYLMWSSAQEKNFWILMYVGGYGKCGDWRTFTDHLRCSPCLACLPALD